MQLGAKLFLAHGHAGMTKLSRFSQFGEKRLTAICVHSIWQSLTPWSRVLLEKLKLTGSLVVKKFTALYVTRRFITAFTGAAICPCPGADQSSPHTPSHFKVHFNIILIYSCLSNGLFPSGFPTISLYAPLLSPYVLQAPPISFFLIWSPK